MTYTDYIETMIKKQSIATPILTAEISKEMEIQFQLPPAKAAAATSVAIKRIMDRKTIPSLRFIKRASIIKLP